MVLPRNVDKIPEPRPLCSLRQWAGAAPSGGWQGHLHSCHAAAHGHATWHTAMILELCLPTRLGIQPMLQQASMMQQHRISPALGRDSQEFQYFWRKIIPSLLLLLPLLKLLSPSTKTNSKPFCFTSNPLSSSQCRVLAINLRAPLLPSEGSSSAAHCTLPDQRQLSG